MSLRFRETQRYLSAYIASVRVVCPQCAGAAEVRCADYRSEAPALTCARCGLTQQGWDRPWRGPARHQTAG